MTVKKACAGAEAFQSNRVKSGSSYGPNQNWGVGERSPSTSKIRTKKVRGPLLVDQGREINRDSFAGGRDTSL